MELMENAWEYYRQHGRHTLPWRQPEADGSFSPYTIWVSEIMLQQTQVSRVVPKYEQFIAQFPDTPTLAAASLGEVLTAWQGLGYNRRAKYLWQAAQQLMAEHGGRLPHDHTVLSALPGIGANTAGAIQAYAFNAPAVFVETNIRTVFIYYCFAGQERVSDTAIRSLVDQTLDREQPRVWYWALMDYGSFLKQTVGNISRNSHAYTRQSPFRGSARQLRGQVLRVLATAACSRDELLRQLGDPRGEAIVAALEREGLIQCRGQLYQLPL